MRTDRKASEALHRAWLLRAICAIALSLAWWAPASAQPERALHVTVSRSAGPLAQGSLRQAVLTRREPLLNCLRAHGDLPGVVSIRATLRVMVASTGEVVTVEVKDGQGLDGERCVAAAVEGTSFPVRAAFTTFTVELRLGRAASSTGAPAPTPTPSNDGRVGLLLTRVRGELRPSAARRGFVAVRSRLQACYAAELRRAPAAPSRLELVVRVDSAGHVLAVGEGSGSALSEGFERCVNAALRRQSFAAPTSGQAEITQRLALGSPLPSP